MPDMKPSPYPTGARALIVALVMAGCATAALAQQHRHREQDAAYAAARSGEIRSLREIEGRVVSKMGDAHYLGPEFDAGSGIYRLKFMRGGSVIWIDIDGRTGREIGRSGR